MTDNQPILAKQSMRQLNLDPREYDLYGLVRVTDSTTAADRHGLEETMKFIHSDADRLMVKELEGLGLSLGCVYEVKVTGHRQKQRSNDRNAVEYFWEATVDGYSKK